MSATDADFLAQVTQMIAQFDDSTFLGEIAATIADRLDHEATAHPAQKAAWQKVIGHLGDAIAVLHTFGDDDEWRDWESFLDKIYDASLVTQHQIVAAMAAALQDHQWQKGLLPLHREVTDFVKAAEAMSAAAAAWPH